MHNQSDPDVPRGVRASGSPDEGDPHDPLDPIADPSTMQLDPERTVPEASEDSFPASDAPTWTGSAVTPLDPRRTEDEGTERERPPG